MIALEREMSATPGEFMHGLRLAFPHGIDADLACIRVHDGEAGMEISLTVLSPRIIAALQLPRLLASIRFTHGSTAQQAAMLARMDRAMQRGGG